MARDLLYAQSHRPGWTYQGLWLPSRGALGESQRTKRSLVGPEATLDVELTTFHSTRCSYILYYLRGLIDAYLVGQMAGARSPNTPPPRLDTLYFIHVVYVWTSWAWSRKLYILYIHTPTSSRVIDFLLPLSLAPSARAPLKYKLYSLHDKFKRKRTRER